MPGDVSPKICGGTCGWGHPRFHILYPKNIVEKIFITKKPTPGKEQARQNQIRGKCQM